MTGCPLSRREAGGATVELVLLTPALIALLMLVVAGGRVATAQQQVNGAARDAARAASIERDPEAARRAAHTTVIAALAQAERTCSRLGVTTDASGFRPGGAVAVQVTCRRAAQRPHAAPPARNQDHDGALRPSGGLLPRDRS
jgi:Flp pilus assembly protein TadG